jgi:hypothetical protein
MFIIYSYEEGGQVAVTMAANAAVWWPFGEHSTA